MTILDNDYGSDLDKMFDAVTEKAGDSLEQMVGLSSRERYVITVNETYSYGPYSKRDAKELLRQILGKHPEHEWAQDNILVVSSGSIRMRYSMTELEEPEEFLFI